MDSLLLPADPRRAELAAFWIAATVPIGALVTLILEGTGVTAGWGPGAAFTGVLAVSGLVSPALARRAYSGWNRWARRYLRLAREVVLGVCHATVFTLSGIAGSRMPSGRPPFRSSGWRERGTTPPEAYPSGGAEPATGAAERGWARETLAWCRSSGNLWAVSLIPYLWLLGVLETRRDEEPPADIYTLY